MLCNCRFFVHIPKTAGTSFRKATEAYFDPDRIAYDYGKQSAETSMLVWGHLYDTQRADRWAFYQALAREDVAIVGGHVNAGRFVDGVGVQNTLTFLREPLQRMASEYLHFCRHHDYNNSFQHFFSRPVMRNRMHKILQGVPLEALGVAGLTERYEESLELINHLYGWDLPFLAYNRMGEEVCAAHEVDSDDEALFYEQNQLDVELFQRAYWLFDLRMSLFREGLPFAHGKIQEVNPHRVAGWAWWARRSSEPVWVEVEVNGEVKGTVPAVEFRPGLTRLSPPRDGHIGFSVKVEASVGDAVVCRVAETGQVLSEQSLRITESQ